MTEKTQLNQIERYFSECAAGDYLPAIFPLGYHVRRNEPRLIYVMPLTMHYEGQVFQVKSKNFSATGLQVFISRTLIQEGKVVQLTFDHFKKNYCPRLGEEIANFDKIDYLTKTVQHTEIKTYLSLEQINLSESAIHVFQRFITKNRLRYKIDASDRIYASKARYYENLYTINMPHIPMFIRWNKKNGLYIDTIIKTERNNSFFNYLSQGNSVGTSSEAGKTDTADFRPFCLPQRIEKFVELARQKESALFFSYWENSRFHSLFDFELTSHDDLTHIADKVKNLKGRIYKVSTNLNKKPAAKKITAMLSKIQAIDPMASKIFHKRASESIAQIVLTDITKIYFRQLFFKISLSYKPECSLDMNILRANQHIRMADEKIIHSYDESIFHIPELIGFNIGHNRYDARYQYEMDVIVKFKNKRYLGRTLDFSRTGFGLLISSKKTPSQEIDITQGCEIKITFSSLMIKGIKTELKNIYHRVMIARQTSAGLFLGVSRNTGECRANVNQFFSTLVKRNRDKLELCIQDKIDSIFSAFYEAFFTENIETIPILIARDRENQHYVRDIGLTNTPCKLAEKFYIRNSGYNFRFLTTQLRLEQLHQRIIKASEKNTQEFMLFLFKRKNRLGVETLFSVADFEIIEDNDIKHIIKIVLDNKGVCVHIRFMNNLLVDKLYRNMTIDKVSALNKSSARLLAKEYKEILGFAEMIDLTREYKKHYA